MKQGKYNFTVSGLGYDAYDAIMDDIIAIVEKAGGVLGGGFVCTNDEEEEKVEKVNSKSFMPVWEDDLVDCDDYPDEDYNNYDEDDYD